MATTNPWFHSDPEILSGTPVFFGTRVPVRTLLDYLEAGDSLNQFLPEDAEGELTSLAHCSEKGWKHLTRLVELLLAGYTIDPSKRLPRGLRVRIEPSAASDRRGT